MDAINNMYLTLAGVEQEVRSMPLVRYQVGVKINRHYSFKHNSHEHRISSKCSF